MVKHYYYFHSFLLELMNLLVVVLILNNLIINEDTKIRVQIDGAMSNDTIQICKDARADDFVMGSAYFNK